MSDDPRHANITAKIILSSLCEETGARLDTFQLRYPRMIHSEVMTHREKSKNASSSRAIPLESMTVRDADYYVPLFRKNKKGMQPGAYLSAAEQAEAETIWRDMAEYILVGARKLAAKDGLNIHKQWVNRPLEWFGYIDVVMSATNWGNFFTLRDDSEAQDEIAILARRMKAARKAAVPQILKPGEWHLPYVDGGIEADIACLSGSGRRQYAAAIRGMFEHPKLAHLDVETRLKMVVSAARSCRVSYSTHDGRPSTLDADIERAGKLTGRRIHASPFEHQGLALGADLGPIYEPGFTGNFTDFAQFRKFIPREYASETDQ